MFRKNHTSQEIPAASSSKNAPSALKWWALLFGKSVHHEYCVFHHKFPMILWYTVYPHYVHNEYCNHRYGLYISPLCYTYIPYSLCISDISHQIMDFDHPQDQQLQQILVPLKKMASNQAWDLSYISMEFRDFFKLAPCWISVGRVSPSYYVKCWFYIPLNQQRPITRLSHSPGRYPHEYPMKNHHVGWLNLPYGVDHLDMGTEALRSSLRPRRSWDGMPWFSVSLSGL